MNPMNDPSLKKMQHFFSHVEGELFNCDDRNDLIAYASVLLTIAFRIYRTTMGDELAREFMQSYVDIRDELKYKHE